MAHHGLAGRCCLRPSRSLVLARSVKFEFPSRRPVLALVNDRPEVICFRNMFPIANITLPLADAGPIVGIVVWAIILLSGLAWVVERRQHRDRSTHLQAAIRQRGGRPTHQLGELVLTVDPQRLLICDSSRGRILRIHNLDPSVDASVGSAGNVSVTRGRNLAKKALAGAVIPGALFVVGNARDQVHDHRELYLIVEADNWAEVHALDPNLGAEARRFAQQINLASRGDRVARTTSARQAHPETTQGRPAS